MDKGKDLYRRDKEFLSSVQKLRFYPFVAERGQGAYLIGSDGKEYLDFSSGWGVATTGYNHPRIIEAVNKQMRKLSFAPTISVINEESVVLAEMLAKMVPGSGPKSVWFGHSGSDANEFIAKIIPIATGKSKLMTFVGSYHGQTMGSYAMSGHPAQNKFICGGSVVKLPYPDCYRCPFEKRMCSCGLFCLSYIEDYIFKTIAPPEQIGAIEIEAIQCDGGDIVPVDGFLQGLQRFCKMYDMLFIIDEVKIGLGRTGKMFGFEHWGVEPDLVVLAKPLGSGQPISAVVGNKNVMDAEVCAHLFTTAGNPVGCAAAIETLNIIKEEKLTENAEEMGVYFKQELEKLKDQYEFIGDVRGKGLVLGVDLVKDERTKEPNPQAAAQVLYRAFELGLLIYNSGLHSNVLEFTPPLIINKEHVDLAIRILKRTFDDVLEGKVAEEKLNLFSGWNA